MTKETNPIKKQLEDARQKAAKAEFIKQHKIEIEYARISQTIEEQKKNEQVDFGRMEVSRVNQIQDIIFSRIEETKVISPFMGFEEFNEINLSGSNLLLVGGLSGTGKSTICANLAITAYQKLQQVLIITNEETVNDCYLRLACLLFGMNINRVADWNKDEISKVLNIIPTIAQRVTVIDDTHGGGFGITTSVEGLEFVCKNLIENNFKYDLIVIDYYQNYSYSKQNASMKDYECQNKVGVILDRFKNDYKKPIVLLAQMEEEVEGKPKPFKLRIEGRKSIYNRCTLAIETIVKKDLLCTDFILRKGRFNENLGTVSLGFKRGLFVKYTPEFKNEVQTKKEEKNQERFKK